jgi:sugar O-acyltransferase (sialic acid O-acetyltransferase NeuD family)
MPRMKNLALVGAGAHAREIMAQMGKSLECFVDDNFADERAKPISSFDPNKCKLLIAVGDSNLRMSMHSKLPESTEFYTFIHPTACIMSDTVQIGCGTFIGANCILTCDITIGNHVLLNRCNQISHDNVLEDFVSLMPGASLNGNVSLQKGVFLGANTSIKENVKINEKIVVGMHSLVTKNLEEPGIYCGVPAKSLKIS